MFDEHRPSSTYSLRTFPGIKETMVRRARCYVIEALDGTVHLSLPSLAECNHIPNNRSDVSTNSSFSLGTRAISCPRWWPKAPIIILLG